MTADLKAPLDGWHLIHGDSAAGCVIQSISIDRDKLIVNRDPIDCGPAPATLDWREWARARGGFLTSLSETYPPHFLKFAERDFVAALNHADESPPIYAWASCGLADQLLLARVLSLRTAAGTSPAHFRVIQFVAGADGVIASLGSLSPARIRAWMPTPVNPGREVVSHYLRAWRAYTSRSAEALVELLSAESPSQVLHQAMAALVQRYPDVRSGLSGTEWALLRAAESEGPRATRIIGQVAAFDAGLDQVGDLVLFAQLKALGSTALREPLLHILGSERGMRDCLVELTRFGRRVLEGRANAAEVNGCHGWVGGVNLAEFPAYRSGNALILP